MSQEGGLEAALDDKQKSLELARSGACEEAWPQWKEATHHIQRNLLWHNTHAPQVKREVAGCFLQRALSAESQEKAIESYIEARFWDHTLSELRTQTAIVAEELDQKGEELFKEEKWKEAYAQFSLALKLDPSRSWTRKRAEDARDKKLRITRPSRKKKKTTTKSTSKETKKKLDKKSKEKSKEKSKVKSKVKSKEKNKEIKKSVVE